MKQYTRKTLSENIQTYWYSDIVTIESYQSKNLCAKFHVKDKTEFNHESILAYYGKYGKYPNKTCAGDYTGETDCRIMKILF